MNETKRWGVLALAMAACVNETRADDDDDQAGARAVAPGLDLGVGGFGSGNGGSSAGGSSGGGAKGGSSCDDPFGGECGSCLETACCSELADCAAAPGCVDCLTGTGAPGCDQGAATAALLACALAACEEPCFARGITGIGTTVEECQGTGDIAGSIGGETPAVQSGFAGQVAGALNVFLYGRPFISAVNFPGNSGEYKVRLVFASPLGGAQYQGIMAVAKWDMAQAQWVDLATPSDTAIITLSTYDIVDPTGLMCNGVVAGQVEALFNASDLVVAAFEVPALTTAFPSQ
jgi:hypothetical protein